MSKTASFVGLVKERASWINPLMINRIAGYKPGHYQLVLLRRTWIRIGPSMKNVAFIMKHRFSCSKFSLTIIVPVAIYISRSKLLERTHVLTQTHCIPHYLHKMIVSHACYGSTLLSVLLAFDCYWRFSFDSVRPFIFFPLFCCWSSRSFPHGEHHPSRSFSRRIFFHFRFLSGWSVNLDFCKTANSFPVHYDMEKSDEMVFDNVNSLSIKLLRPRLFPFILSLSVAKYPERYLSYLHHSATSLLHRKKKLVVGTPDDRLNWSNHRKMNSSLLTHSSELSWEHC